MSYPVELKEVNSATLAKELSRRLDRHNVGVCHYCNRLFGEEPSCKLMATHRGEQI